MISKLLYNDDTTDDEDEEEEGTVSFLTDTGFFFHSQSVKPTGSHTISGAIMHTCAMDKW